MTDKRWLGAELLALNSCDDRFALAARALKFVERRPLA